LSRRKWPFFRRERFAFGSAQAAGARKGDSKPAYRRHKCLLHPVVLEISEDPGGRKWAGLKPETRDQCAALVSPGFVIVLIDKQ
jgi:hypothetical protein